MANAISLFPLGLLALSIVSSKLTEWLLSGSKITLTIAGGYALFAMLEDQGEKNASRVIESIPPFTGPPTPPRLAPAKHTHPKLLHPEHQAGKVLAINLAAPSAKAERRRRARERKKVAERQRQIDQASK